MADVDIIVIQQETDRIVFAENKYLSFAVHDRPTGGHELKTGPIQWYASKEVTLVKDRWVYAFAMLGRPNADTLPFTRWRLLHEYYVDGEGHYWRSDEADLFDGDPSAQRVQTIRHRRDALKAKQHSSAGEAYARLPYYIDAEKCTIVTVAMAYPLPAESIVELLEVAKTGQMPWAVGWGSSSPKVHIVGATEVAEIVDDGQSTTTRMVPADIVLTADPLELAVRTNRKYQGEVEALRTADAEQSDKERFARELHQMLNSSPSMFAQAKPVLDGHSLAGIEASFAESERKLRKLAAQFEARARVLCEFMKSKLFGATMRAYRKDDESSSDSERFVYFLYGLDAATDQLSHSRSGHDFLSSMTRVGGAFGAHDPIDDYVFPAALTDSQRTRNVKKALSPILSLYSKLLPRLGITDAVLAHQLVRKHLTAFTGHEFVALKRLPEIIPDGFFVEYKNSSEVIGGTWISRDDLKTIQKIAKREAVTKIENRKIHSGARSVLDRVLLLLDVINLVLLETELEQKRANGAMSFRDDYQVFSARMAVGIGAATAYAKWRVGEKASAVLLGKLAIVGAIPAFNTSMMAIADSFEAFDKGQYGKFAGHAVAGWVGLVGAVAMLTPGPGWVVVAAGLIAAGGAFVASAFTEEPLEKFFRFCEWGVKGNGKELADRPKYSKHRYSAWEGQCDRQREALSRILCSFSLEAVHEPKRRGVKLTMGHFRPESVIRLDWDLLLRKGDDVPEERITRTQKISGRALGANPRMIVYEPFEMREPKGLRVDLSVTVTLDVRGDGEAPIPTKGCKLVLIELTKIVSGARSSLDVAE